MEETIVNFAKVLIQRGIERDLAIMHALNIFDVCDENDQRSICQQFNLTDDLDLSALWRKYYAEIGTTPVEVS